MSISKRNFEVFARRDDIAGIKKMGTLLTKEYMAVSVMVRT